MMNLKGQALQLNQETVSELPRKFWRPLGRRTLPEELPKGLDAWWHGAAGWFRRRALSTSHFMARAESVLALEGFSGLPDRDLKSAAEEMKIIFRLNRETRDDIHRAAALIREGSRRVFGFSHHLEQIAGALALTEGCIAEMATGEGKTLTAVIPAILAAWRGRGCHVLTVNDYLAARDAEEMGRLYQYFGLTAAAVSQESEPAERRAAYAADISYLTNKEAAADFLRDRLCLGPISSLSAAILESLSGRGMRTGDLVQRGLEYAIVDEADSVLVDEAVTPLLISGDSPNAEETQAFQVADQLAAALEDHRHYKIDRQFKEITLTKEGQGRLTEAAEGLSGFWQGRRRREEMVVQALNARTFFRRDQEYIIDDGQVVIVDESTGRLMPDRTWRGGLHQAVEVKEGLEPTPPKATFARLSFQRFFRLYRHLSGMTGTGLEATKEFWQIYKLPVTRIPTHQPCQRRAEPPRIFLTAAAKWRAATEEIRRVHQSGRPVLVGSRSIQDSEKLSAALGEEINHRVLNAVFHEEEAEIVKQAGGLGRVTVATNMAGRGTDIKLSPETAELGGLYVISVERNLTPRVDRQLYGRGARQGDPGGVVVLVSLEDELVRRFRPWLAALAARLFKSYGDGPLPDRLMKIFDLAAWKAERQALGQRRQVLQADTWLRDTLGFAGKDL